VARKVDEAVNFVFVQLIEQEPGIYEKRHPDYARRDKIRDLTWERIFHEMKESGMSAQAVQTATTTGPVLCDTSQQLG
jgi:hypothetical protein